MSHETQTPERQTKVTYAYPLRGGRNSSTFDQPWRSGASLRGRRRRHTDDNERRRKTNVKRRDRSRRRSAKTPAVNQQDGEWPPARQQTPVKRNQIRSRHSRRPWPRTTLRMIVVMRMAMMVMIMVVMMVATATTTATTPQAKEHGVSGAGDAIRQPDTTSARWLRLFCHQIRRKHRLRSPNPRRCTRASKCGS